MILRLYSPQFLWMLPLTYSNKILQDPTLPQRTNMSVQHIMTLLEFHLKNTYFLFQGKYYEQVHGTALDSPISPLITNLFMEECEVKALSSAHAPHLWLRYVDDTFVIQEAEHSQQLLQHINTQPTHMVYCGGTGPRWITAIHGHPGFTRPQQHPHHNSLQKVHTYRSISTLGQLNTMFSTHWHIGPK